MKNVHQTLFMKIIFNISHMNIILNIIKSA